MLVLVLKIIGTFYCIDCIIVMVWGTYNIKIQNKIHTYLPIFLMEIDINEEGLLSLKVFMRAEEGRYDIHNTDYYSGIILQINK